jgi:hypothetical protein
LWNEEVHDIEKNKKILRIEWDTTGIRMIKKSKKPCFHLAFFSCDGGRDAASFAAVFRSLYNYNDSTSLPNQPAAAKLCWPQLQNSFRSWTEKLAIAAAFCNKKCFQNINILIFPRFWGFIKY